MFFHILLLIFITVLVGMFSSQREGYLFSVGSTLSNTFLPPGFIIQQFSKNGFDTTYFYKISDVLGHLDKTIENYFVFVETESLDYFQYYDEKNRSSTKEIIMTIQSYPNLVVDMNMDFQKPIDRTTQTKVFHLKRDSDTPFDIVRNNTLQLRRLFHSLVSIETKFSFRKIFTQRKYPEIITVDVYLHYDFTERGGRTQLTLKHNINLSSLNSDNLTIDNVITSSLFWICLIVLLLSIISSFLNFRAIFRSLQYFSRANTDSKLSYYSVYGSFPMSTMDRVEVEETILQSPINRSETPVDAVNEERGLLDDGTNDATNNDGTPIPVRTSLLQRLKFLNFWHVVALIGHIISACGSVATLCNIFYFLDSLVLTNVLLGLSVLLSWINVVQYFAHAPGFYVLITTLRRGFPNVFKFIIGAVPILIGYSLCGMVLFGSFTMQFSGFCNSVVTLFSAANGDAIHDTFDSTYGQNPIIAYFSRIYVMSFIAMFTYSVLNIFILIMEDAYFTVKEGGITDKLQRDFKDALNVVFDNKIGEARKEDKRRREQAVTYLSNLRERRGESKPSSPVVDLGDLTVRSRPKRVNSKSSSYEKTSISESIDDEIRYLQQMGSPPRPIEESVQLLVLLEKLKDGQINNIHSNEQIVQMSEILINKIH
ncbi:hypothetical protein AKO1_014957, partial [Acrasis kona]